MCRFAPALAGGAWRWGVAGRLGGGSEERCPTGRACCSVRTSGGWREWGWCSRLHRVCAAAACCCGGMCACCRGRERCTHRSASRSASRIRGRGRASAGSAMAGAGARASGDEGWGEPTSGFPIRPFSFVQGSLPTCEQGCTKIGPRVLAQCVGDSRWRRGFSAPRTTRTASTPASTFARLPALAEKARKRACVLAIALICAAWLPNARSLHRPT